MALLPLNSGRLHGKVAAASTGMGTSISTSTFKGFDPSIQEAPSSSHDTAEKPTEEAEGEDLEALARKAMQLEGKAVEAHSRAQELNKLGRFSGQ